MKIAFVANNTYAPWGGSEELWSLAALRLHAARHAVLACVQNWEPQPQRLLEFARAGLPMAVIRPKRAMRIRERLRAKFRGEPPRELQQAIVDEAIVPFQPDLVVISQMQNLDGAFWARAVRQRNLPYALIAQAASEMSWPEDYLWSVARDAHACARRSFFVSHHNLELTQREIGMRLPRGEVVHNPFALMPDQPATWPATTPNFRLASVGRLEPPSKGQDLLFSVLSRPRWRERPIEVTLYGNGRHEESVRGLAAYYGLLNVKFGGFASDIAGLWKEHHGLILSSRLEGTPLALIEAMLCHRLGIVTPVGGNAELVEDGISGFVTGAVSADALDAAMERAWERRHEWCQMGLAAGERVRRIVPRDPVAAFADRLLAVAAEPA